MLSLHFLIEAIHVCNAFLLSPKLGHLHSTHHVQILSTEQVQHFTFLLLLSSLEKVKKHKT